MVVCLAIFWHRWPVDLSNGFDAKLLAVIVIGILHAAYLALFVTKGGCLRGRPTLRAPTAAELAGATTEQAAEVRANTSQELRSRAGNRGIESEAEMKVFVSSLISGMEPLRAAAKAAIEELGGGYFRGAFDGPDDLRRISSP